MYSMIGICPESIFIEESGFAMRNLADASDEEAQRARAKLTRFFSERILGLEKTKGIVLHSGSEANEIALYMARKKTGKRFVLTTNIAHSSIKNACDKLEMKILTVDAKPEKGFQADEKEVIKILETYGPNIAMVNATHGTTYFGNSEGFIFNPEVEELCMKHGIWVHVDAAYGGTILNLTGHPNAIRISASLVVSSVAVDTTKFIGAIGAGILMLKEAKDKKLAGHEADYFTGNMSALGTTRSAFPVATALATIEQFGIEGLRALAALCTERAKNAGKEIGENGFSMLAPIESGVVPIKCESEKELEHLMVGLLEKGFRVSPIRISGKNYSVLGIRIVITPKKEMTDENIARFVGALSEVVTGK